MPAIRGTAQQSKPPATQDQHHADEARSRPLRRICTCSECRLLDDPPMLSYWTIRRHEKSDEAKRHRMEQAARDIEEAETSGPHDDVQMASEAPSPSPTPPPSPGSWPFSRSASPIQFASLSPVPGAPTFPEDDGQDDGGDGSEASHDNDGDGDGSPGPDNGFNLQDDPLFRRMDAIFGGPDEPDHDPFGEDPGNHIPAAFREHPFIRNAYIEAFIASSFHGATHDLCNLMLDNSYHQLLAFCDNSPETTHDLQEGLATMARTIRTAERRLGVDPDQYIIFDILCPICWKRYTSEEMSELDGPQCTAQDCEGHIYTVATLEHGVIKRVPNKILPRTDFLQQLGLMLRRPGKYQELQEWRKYGDEVGEHPPLAVPRPSEYDAFPDRDERLYDVTDGWVWRTVRAGLERHRVHEWRVEDVDVQEVHQRLVSLPCGLMISITIDWFRGLKKGTKHSTGAVYATVLNNPRSKRFLREETILVCVIPGPHEPSLEQLNSILDPFVEDLHELYNGIDLHVYDHDLNAELALIHGALLLNISDLPASRKVSGCLSHSSKKFMCTDCTMSVPQLSSVDAFNPRKFTPRDPWTFVKYAYKSTDFETEAEREECAEMNGARWSPLTSLPGWFPSLNCPTDFMHTTYLGEVDHVLHTFIGKGALFAHCAPNHYPARRFEEFLANVWWPNGSGRVPSKVASSGSATADQLRNLASVFPVALYAAWQIDGEIPNRAPPRPDTRTKAHTILNAYERASHQRRTELHALERHDGDDLVPLAFKPLVRNISQFYDALLNWATAIRIWSSRSITPEEISRAQEAHDTACRAWVRMGHHLTQVFHYSCHNDRRLLRFGPVYGWWTYPGERNNGYLGNLKHNNHAGGVCEATMLRGWIKASLIFQLIEHLRALGPNQTSQDRRAIETLQGLVRGESKDTRQRGTLLSMIASMAARDSNDDLTLPRHGRGVSLRNLGLYVQVLRYLQELWRGQATLVNDNAPRQDGAEAFLDVGVVSYASILVYGLRYGAVSHQRGRGSRYGYIDGRTAVEIQHILHIKHERRDPNLPTLEAVCIITKSFQNEAVPEMPWSLREIDLGIETWQAHELGDLTIGDARLLCGHFALAEVDHPTGKLWVTMSLCHDAQEPDVLDED